MYTHTSLSLSLSLSHTHTHTLIHTHTHTHTQTHYFHYCGDHIQSSRHIRCQLLSHYHNYNVQRFLE